MVRSSRPSVLAAGARAVLLIALYLIAARIGRVFDHVHEDARVLLPQAGVALAGLLIFGLRYWPAVAVASLLVTLTAHWPIPFWQDTAPSFQPSRLLRVNPPTALALAASNTLMALCAAWLLQRIARFASRMSRLRDVYAFLIIGVVLAPALGAALAVLLAVRTEPLLAQSPLFYFLRRWFGLGISNLVIAPALLTWSARYRVYPRDKAKWGEALLLTLSAIFCSLLVFTRQSAVVLNVIDNPLSFIPFPFVLWASLRFGLRGASTITLIISVISMVGTSQGYGPFARFGGSEALFILQIYLLVIGTSGLFIAAAIAQHTDAEQRLLETQDQLRALSNRLQEAREEERTMIAREIHDELGQQLTGLKMGLHAIMRRAAPQAPDLAERAGELVKLSEEAVDSVRRIATDLRPGILDDLGIVASLQWLVDDFRQRTGLNASFSSNVAEIDLPRAHRTVLFRILQESLTNVTRHAQASRVSVALDVQSQAISLTVEDNGVGITEKTMNGRKSLGLIGMRERAALVGGTLEVGALSPISPSNEETPTSGTRVTAHIPWTGRS